MIVSLLCGQCRPVSSQDYLSAYTSRERSVVNWHHGLWSFLTYVLYRTGWMRGAWLRIGSVRWPRHWSLRPHVFCPHQRTQVRCSLYVIDIFLLIFLSDRTCRRFFVQRFCSRGWRGVRVIRSCETSSFHVMLCSNCADGHLKVSGCFLQRPCWIIRPLD